MKVKEKNKKIKWKYIFISELKLEGWMFGSVYSPEPGGEDMRNPEQDKEYTQFLTWWTESS